MKSVASFVRELQRPKYSQTENKFSSGDVKNMMALALTEKVSYHLNCCPSFQKSPAFFLLFFGTTFEYSARDLAPEHGFSNEGVGGM